MELQNLWLHYYPNAVAVLFRTFLELTVNELQSVATIYVPPDKHNQNSWDRKKLYDKIEMAIDFLFKNGHIDKSKKMAISLLCRDNYRVVDILHQYVHSEDMYPDEQQLRTVWDNTQHLFVAVWAKVPRPEQN